MEKTVKEWIDTIESENIRNKFYTNVSLHNKYKSLNEKTTSLEIALASAFAWNEVREPFTFWSNMARKAGNGTLPLRDNRCYEIF